MAENAVDSATSAAARDRVWRELADLVLRAQLHTTIEAFRSDSDFRVRNRQSGPAFDPAMPLAQYSRRALTAIAAAETATVFDNEIAARTAMVVRLIATGYSHRQARERATSAEAFSDSLPVLYAQAVLAGLHGPGPGQEERGWLTERATQFAVLDEAIAFAGAGPTMAIMVGAAYPAAARSAAEAAAAGVAQKPSAAMVLAAAAMVDCADRRLLPGHDVRTDATFVGGIDRGDGSRLTFRLLATELPHSAASDAPAAVATYPAVLVAVDEFCRSAYATSYVDQAHQVSARQVAQQREMIIDAAGHSAYRRISQVFARVQSMPISPLCTVLARGIADPAQYVSTLTRQTDMGLEAAARGPAHGEDVQTWALTLDQQAQTLCDQIAALPLTSDGHGSLTNPDAAAAFAQQLRTDFTTRTDAVVALNDLRTRLAQVAVTPQHSLSRLLNTVGAVKAPVAGRSCAQQVHELLAGHENPSTGALFTGSAILLREKLVEAGWQPHREHTDSWALRAPDGSELACTDIDGPAVAAAFPADIDEGVAEVLDMSEPTVTRNQAANMLVPEPTSVSDNRVGVQAAGTTASTGTATL